MTVQPPCNTDGNYEVVRNIADLLMSAAVADMDVVEALMDAVVDAMRTTNLSRLAKACPHCFGYHAFEKHRLHSMA